MQPLGGDNLLIRTAKSPKKSHELRFAATRPKKSKKSQEFLQKSLSLGSFDIESGILSLVVARCDIGKDAPCDPFLLGRFPHFSAIAR
jgi:hypothetical protein